MELLDSLRHCVGTVDGWKWRRHLRAGRAEAARHKLGRWCFAIAAGLGCTCSSGLATATGRWKSSLAA